MKRELIENEHKIYHYVDNKKVEGIHLDISGDVSGISGDVSGIRGDVTGIYGNVSGISGDVDNCEITAEERMLGIDIKELIGNA